VRQGRGQVDAPLLAQGRAEDFQIADHHGRLVDVHALERHTRHALGQIGGFGEQAQAQLVGVEAEQLTGIVRQVPHQDLVFVAGVLGQRPDQGHAAALVAEHAGDVQERLPVRAGLVQPGFGQHGAFLAQLQAEVPQAGLGLLEQACQGDGGAHVRQGIVGSLVAQAIGLGEVLQLEGGAAVVMLGPLDAFGAQGPGGADHVQQVPAAAAVLPFAGIGVDEVTPEQVTRDLVVKADGVVAHADGVRLGQSCSMALANACSGTPCSRQVCGRMPVSRQASGSGR
jgi:hypothetical protein